MASKALEEIRTLDPERDHQRIVFLSCRIDFPWDTTRALELALFRSFCIPSISELLCQTGEFERRSQKRYDDTDIIVSEIMEHGYDSERGRAALKRMNQIHGRFHISNEDFLYVLSTFIYVPIRWNEAFGWRRMTDAEKIAQYHFWKQVGIRMNIREIPPDLKSFEAWSLDYERAHYRYTEFNARIGAATRQLFMSWFPAIMRPMVRRGIHAMLDEALLNAFGFPHPSPFLRSVVGWTMRSRAHLLRLAPRRKQPVLRTAMKHPSYPGGYQIACLGPAPTEKPIKENAEPG